MKLNNLQVKCPKCKGKGEEHKRIKSMLFGITSISTWNKCIRCKKVYLVSREDFPSKSSPGLFNISI